MSFMEEFKHLEMQLESIKSATDNFSDNNVIGGGGFGKVYKGVLSLSNGQRMVAFKRLNRQFGQGNPEFWKEVMILSRYDHGNLIKLIGYCTDKVEMILVYEYASNGSLDRHLHTTTLMWTRRLKICLQAARGLSHLHDPMGTQQRVLHRDIKSANILIDENWNAKIADLGLSKIGPANQPYTALISNAVGTPGYLDPLYLETYVLTKESDTYSFGVVLFEVLCGKLCVRRRNEQLQILVSFWKRCYEEKRLDEIIFQHLKEQIDQRCLETFSDIAYQCLLRSQKERPKMAFVVQKLETALRFQECYDVKVPQELKEIIKDAMPTLTYGSLEELHMLLSKGIFLNGGKTWFSRNKDGVHCEMMSVAACLIDDQESFSRYRNPSKHKSRFTVDNFVGRSFKTHVKTQFLSRGITYTVNLVFKLIRNKVIPIKLLHVALMYKLEGEAEYTFSYLADVREDGWLMAELYQFTCNQKDVEFEIIILGPQWASQFLIVEGIELWPLQKVEHRELEDLEVQMRQISDWQQKLPSDYEEIIKQSDDSLKWTTNEELYLLMRKGFLINNGEEWFSLDKNGKKCFMLPVTATLDDYYWRWESLPESRFRQVAYNSSIPIDINCDINSQNLSPQTTYASYLVYKVPEDYSQFKIPIRVRDRDVEGDWREVERFIYLLTPRTPVLLPKFGENTHNRMNRLQMKGLPHLRNDGWMEVQVWEFQTGNATGVIPMQIELYYECVDQFDGLIVEGIEFRPI